MEWMAVIVILGLAFLSGPQGRSILDVIRGYNRQKHIEKIIAQVPENERGDVIRSYLDNPAEIAKKFAEMD